MTSHLGALVISGLTERTVGGMTHLMTFAAMRGEIDALRREETNGGRVELRDRR
jgi:hypothetical protein